MNPSQLAPRRYLTDWLDRAAVGASALCLVHCAGLPLLLAALPSLSRLIAIPESFHLWILGFAIPTSAAALIAGWRRHGALYPVMAGCIGLALVAAGALVLLEEQYETGVTMAGSLWLVFAHLSNWRLRHRRHCHGHAVANHFEDGAKGS